MAQAVGRAGLMGKFRLFCYRYLYRGFGRRHRDITASEVLSADVIRLMGNPTVSEFASFVGISQPNATYKIKNLVKKGYLKKIRSPKDRRVIRLAPSEKFEQMRAENEKPLLKMEKELSSEFTREEIETAERVLDAAFRIMGEEKEI